MPHVSLALFLCALLAAPPQDPPPILTPERLQELIKECRPLVEKAAGRKFPKEPVAAISSAEEVGRILTEELKPQMKLFLKDNPGAEVDLAAKGLAEAVASRAMGKFAFSTKVLYVVPATFEKMAGELKMERIRTPAFVRGIVIHELAHALDEESYGLAAMIAACKTSEELEVVGALMEGHAQFVTEAVLKAEGQEELFRDLDRAITSPPTAGEGEKYFTELQNQAARFAYGKGHAFFTELSKSGRATFVDDVFKSPPKRKAVILKPETFYKPAAERRAPADLQPFLEEFGKAETPEGWRRQVVKVDEAYFRSLFSDFVEAAKIDKACETYLAGTVLVRTKADGSAMVAIGIVETADAAAAGSMVDLNLEISKAKDERMKEGNIRITESEVVPFKTEHADRVVCIRKTVMVGEQKVAVKTWLLQRGRFTIEAISSNAGVTDAEADATFKKIADHLKTVK